MSNSSGQLPVDGKDNEPREVQELRTAVSGSTFITRQHAMDVYMRQVNHPEDIGMKRVGSVGVGC